MRSLEEMSKHVRNDERTLVMQRIPGQNVLTNTGMIDNRIYKGETNMKIVRDPTTMMWNFKYEHGVLPEKLKCTFTSFREIIRFANDYFKKRNLEIVEIID